MGIASELKAVAELADKYPEMRQLIFKIQTDAMDLQEKLQEKTDRVRELENEVARLKAWDEEKQKYDLRDLATGEYEAGALVYISLTLPLHALCPNCFANGEKSFLQSNGEPSIREHRFECRRCGTKVAATKRQLATSGEES